MVCSYLGSDVFLSSFREFLVLLRGWKGKKAKKNKGKTKAKSKAKKKQKAKSPKTETQKSAKAKANVSVLMLMNLLKSLTLIGNLRMRTVDMAGANVNVLLLLARSQFTIPVCG